VRTRSCERGFRVALVFFGTSFAAHDLFVTLLGKRTETSQMKTCPVCGKNYSDTSTLCPIDASVLERKDDPLLGQTLAGKYLVEKLIKRGGMGAVYVGKHILMDKTVAIKVLHPALALDDDVVRRFSREAKAASRISHPHAVSVTDFGESETGVVFLVMEYLDGRTLKEIIRSEGQMRVDRVAEIVRQVSGALDAAHEQGVVHRDLKSDNIMVAQTNGGEWAKVLDFGIAKIQQGDSRDIDITAANLVIGTPQYMSPEQCSQSGAIDARSDIYSLGIIIYEMLSGQVPFSGESPTVIMMKQVQDPPPSILDARPDLSPAIAAVISKALAKQPNDRFQTAGGLSAALAAASVTNTAEFAAPATVPIAPVAAMDDEDEVTLVRPREPAPRAAPEFLPAAAVADAAPVSVRPWRILAPAAIVLIAVFALVFFLTRGSGQNQANVNANLNTPGLTVDPNSQPVQATSPATGEGERNIQPQPITSATPPVVITEANANLNPGANANSRPQSTPATVIGNFGSNKNSNANMGEAPTPRPTPRKADDTAPPPRSSPSIRPVPKPTASPIGA
jgi:serine/threonine protein kinase